MNMTKGKKLGLIISIAMSIIFIASGILVLNPPTKNSNPSTPPTTNNSHKLREYEKYRNTLDGEYDEISFTPSDSNYYFLYVEGCNISSIKSGTDTISLSNYTRNVSFDGTLYDYKYTIYLQKGKTYTIKTTIVISDIKLYIY